MGYGRLRLSYKFNIMYQSMSFLYNELIVSYHCHNADCVFYHVDIVIYLELINMNDLELFTIQLFFMDI